MASLIEEESGWVLSIWLFWEFGEEVRWKDRISNMNFGCMDVSDLKGYFVDLVR